MSGTQANTAVAYQFILKKTIFINPTLQKHYQQCLKHKEILS